MNDSRGLKVKSDGVLNSDAFLEASREELRVLIAVMERPFQFATAEQLSKAAGVSRARASSALTLFTEAGIFIREGDVSYEFEKRRDIDEPIERTAVEIAANIRKKELGDLFTELASMMGRDCLNTDEIRLINALIADEGLSEEYILTLSAHLAEKGNLAVKKIVRHAENLIKSSVDTPELLDDYIKSRESSSATLEGEFRKLFGRYGKSITKTELDYYKKWTQTLGFIPEVILLAQDINVRAKSDYTYAYMDAILERWHECGCKTPEECERQAELDRVRIAEEKRRENTKENYSSKSKAPTTKFGDFDPTEALQRALERSYSKYSDDDTES